MSRGCPSSCTRRPPSKASRSTCTSDADAPSRCARILSRSPLELRKSVEEDRYAVVIDQNRLEAESVGINAIPAHIFGRRYLVMGAQPYDAFKEVLERLQEDQAAG
jgi:predicted DsbA family dithiol-disulfide isomerase